MKFIAFFFHYIIFFNLFKKKNQINIKAYKIRNIHANNKRKLSNAHGIDDLIVMSEIESKSTYISSTSNEKGDIYILVNSEDSFNSNRLIYKIKRDYSYESKLILLTSPVTNQYPILTIIKIIDKEYLISYSNLDGHFEVIDYDNERMYYSSTIERGMMSTSEILKNCFINLKFHNNEFYVVNAFIDKMIEKFKIEKLYFPQYNIQTNPIQLSTENIKFIANKGSQVSCFEIENYIECLYSNLQNLYTISIFGISNLIDLYSKTIDANRVNDNQLFSKCIYAGNNLGAFFYYIDDSNFPKLQFKYLETSPTIILNDYFDKIESNSQGAFPLKGNYIYNEFIKTNDNNIYYINTEFYGINFYIVLIKLLNNAQNIIINYYNIKLNENYNTAIYKDINAFSLNGLLGLGITAYNHNIDSEPVSAFFIFGYLTSQKDISINLDQNIIFNEDNIYKIEVNKLIEKIYFRNNVFNYEFAGIKFKSSLNEENGFYIYSKELDNKIKEGQIISTNEEISFKIISEIGVKLGNYSIKYEIIIKEPDYENFILNDGPVEFISKNDYNSNNNTFYSSFYKPDYFFGKESNIKFIINECYKTCQTCLNYGDKLNHHCDTCSINYPFSYSTINGFNCEEKCPENYITSENNICLFFQEEYNEEENKEEENKEEEEDNEEKNKEEENKEEENKEEEFNEEENNEEEDNEGENKEEENKEEENKEEENNIEKEQNLIENNEEEEGKDKKEEDNSHNENEKLDNEKGSKREEENIINEVIKNNENKCKKYFYFDEESKIHCIEGDKCIDKYPHLDKNIENLCTNCIFKYKKRCYMDCPENTCIKQDINLDTCIDINKNIKVINQICFENFQELISNVKEMSENNIIIENIPNLTIYVYDIEKNISYFEEKKLTYIYFNDIEDTLIKEFNLNENDKIYALIVDSPSKYSNSTINDYGFVLLLENGTELNLSNLNEDLKVKISLPIINLDLTNFNYANSLSNQGYDIYDKNSGFYHDICTPGYLDDDDIAFKDRKKEIFPNNITMGKTNCEYKLSDLNNKRFIYDCNLNEVNKDNTNNNEKNMFEEEGRNENFMNYVLDVVNYKVLICSMLFMNIDNFRHNKAVMICTTSIFISVLLLIIFLCSRLSKIRILMHKEIPSSHKINKLLVEKKINNSNFSNNYNLSNPNKKKNSCIILSKREKKKKILEKIKRFQNSLDNNLISKTDLSKDKDNSTKKGLSKLNYLKNKKMEKKIEKEDSDNYDDLPFNMALRMDDRKMLYIFKLKITEKLTILDIFINKQIKEILLSEYFLYLLIDLTMNAILYSDNIVSHKSHNNGKLDTIITLSLSAFANILSSIIDYYLGHLIGFEERIFQIKEIKKEFIFLRVFKIIYREIIIRVIIFFILEIIIILFCTYYLFIFFTIYHKSQMSLLKNYLISLIENYLINISVAIFIVIFRKIGIYFRNKYIYNCSKYLDKNF